MFDNLKRELRALERQSISVPIDSDEKGYIDKECPSSNCEFQFKIKGEDWTNICRDEGVWCPMCGHASPARNWFTKAQVRHAERHARRVIEATIDGAMRADARAFCVFHAIADTHFTGSRTAFHGKADTVSR